MRVLTSASRRSQNRFEIASTAAHLTNPAVGNRLRDDAEALGEYAAEYVRSRVSPEA